jgi:hypothetical protein
VACWLVFLAVAGGPGCTEPYADPSTNIPKKGSTRDAGPPPKHGAAAAAGMAGGADAGGMDSPVADPAAGTGGTGEAPTAAEPDGGPPTTKNGAHCETDTDCGSGHCVMNLCCATTCETDLPESCGLTGACDETGACKKYGKETTCLPESCSAGSGTYSPPVFCDGTGACPVAARTTMSCQGAPCDGNHCQMGCGPGSNCAPGNYCKGGTCALQKGSGLACSDGTECSSGFCVDGMCCDTACTQKCYSCSTGSCKPIAPHVKSEEDCPAALTTSCGNNGACDGSGGCEKYGPETVCSAAGCSNSAQFGTGTCNGTGSCSRSTKPCDFGCSGDICRPCSTKQDTPCGSTCRPGKIGCDGECHPGPVADRGTPCGDGRCSNSCQDGECKDQCFDEGGTFFSCGKVRCGFNKGDPCEPGSAHCGNGECKPDDVCSCADPAGGVSVCDIAMKNKPCGPMGQGKCTCTKSNTKGVCP